MNEIVKYETEDLNDFQVVIDKETVWLTQAQMVMLFERNQSVVSRHISNIFKEKELDENSNMHFLHIANADRPVAFYSLDVIISVGYRVKSQRGTQFRQWATKVLREHLLKGYTVKQPVSIEHLQEMKQNLEYQIENLRQQIENIGVVTNEQYSELYQALIELTAQKRIEESKPRRRIGFVQNNE